MMLPIVFDVHVKTEGDTPDIIHPEPHFHLILDLPNQALVGNDTEIIDVQNDWGNHRASIGLIEHEQSSVDT